MSALSRTLPALIAASVLLLAGCDKVADKVADNAAGQIDDQKARSEFVTNCAKSAVESSKGSINNEAATTKPPPPTAAPKSGRKTSSATA